MVIEGVENNTQLGDILEKENLSWCQTEYKK